MREPFEDANKLALIIGIDVYRTDGLEDLPSCKKDAEDLHKTLSDLDYAIFGNQAIIASESDEPIAWAKIHAAIRDFFGGAKPHQTLLFYFSGHGIIRENEIYLAMPEVNPHEPIVEGYSLSNLSKLMNSSTSKNIVSIIDACYSGAATLPGSRMKDKAAQEIAGSALATYDKVLDNIPRAEGRYFLLSSQAYQKSLADPSSNSLYTKYLVEGLRGIEETLGENEIRYPGSVDSYGNVTPESLHEFVYNKVANEAKQVPKIKSDKSSKIILAHYPQLMKEARGTNFDVSELIEEGRQYLQNGDYGEANKLFNKALLRNSRSAIAYNYKGDAFYRQSKYDKALEYYDDALKINPKYIDALKMKGLVLDKLTRYEDAIQCFSAALELNSRDSEILYYKGLSFSNLSKFDDAINYYDEALKINANYTQALKQKMLALINLRKVLKQKMLDVEKRIEDLRPMNIAPVIPQDISSTISDAVKATEHGDYESAIELLDRAIEEDLNNPLTYKHKGHILIKMKKHNEAVECFNRVLDLYPKDAITWNYIGLSFYAIEKYEEAINCYDEALKIKSDYAEVQYYKGRALHKSKKYGEALNYYEKVKYLQKLDPDFAKVIDNEHDARNSMRLKNFFK